MIKKKSAALMAAVLLTAAVPALAQQFSDSYTFLKGVRERNGATVGPIVANPSSTAINARESGSGEGGLHIVTRARDLTWLNYLLANRARADLQDNQGNTALNIAAQLGWSEGVVALLRRGASVDLPNNRGETPLISAVQRRDAVTARLLLAGGADPNRTDSVAGYSAIDYARRDTRSAQLLQLLQQRRTTRPAAAGPSR